MTLPAPYFSRDGIELYHGDCRELLPELDRIDHVITDPPYEREAHTLGRRVMRGGKKDVISVEPIPFESMDEATRSSVAFEFGRLVERWLLVFCQVEAIAAWRHALEQAGLAYRRACVWVKPDAQPQLSGDRPACGYETILAMHAPGRSRWNAGGRNGVWTCNKNARPEGNCHPTEKPEKLMRDLVRAFTDPGECVLDPFAGSGSTLRACLDEGRRCIGIEKDERYCETAALRLAQRVLPFERPNLRTESVS